MQNSGSKKNGIKRLCTFHSDSADDVLLEIYCNPENKIRDYPPMNPLIVHLAFTDHDPDITKTRLTAAEPTFLEDLNLPDGGRIMRMRDPWGLAIQFCKRTC